jgi:hypothetical protein
MTAVATQVQFFKAIIQYGVMGVLETMPNITLNVPENYAIPPMIGNYCQLNFGQGFINPSLEVDLVFRDTSTGLMAASGSLASPGGLFDYLLLRTNDAAYDTLSIGDITVQPSGVSDGFVLKNAKVGAVSLSCSKGGEIQCHVSFMGAAVITQSTALTFTGWSTANILRFKNVNFTSPLDNQVWEFGFSYSNNLAPDMSLNGSEFPASQLGGMPTASFNANMQINSRNYAPNNGTFPAPTTPTALGFTIVGTTRTLTFNAPNPINNVGRSRSIQAPRIMQAYNATLLGATSFGLPCSIVVA